MGQRVADLTERLLEGDGGFPKEAGRSFQIVLGGQQLTAVFTLKIKPSEL